MFEKGVLSRVQRVFREVELPPFVIFLSEFLDEFLWSVLLDFGSKFSD